MELIVKKEGWIIRIKRTQQCGWELIFFGEHRRKGLWEFWNGVKDNRSDERLAGACYGNPFQEITNAMKLFILWIFYFLLRATLFGGTSPWDDLAILKTTSGKPAFLLNMRFQINRYDPFLECLEWGFLRISCQLIWHRFTSLVSEREICHRKLSPSWNLLQKMDGCVLQWNKMN